jgi:phenylalanyl-tRNA synthetase alpha subunit
VSANRNPEAVDPATISTALRAIEADGLARLESAADLTAVREVERDLLGKRSQLARLHTLLGRLAPEQRREVGSWINTTRARLQEQALASAAALREAAQRSRPNGSISPSSPALPYATPSTPAGGTSTWSPRRAPT